MLTKLPTLENKAYRHLKSGRPYALVCVGYLEKTLEPHVVYKDLEGRTWIRPYSEFIERFKVIG